MIDSKILYELFSQIPAISNYNIIIGGGSLPATIRKGSVIISLVNSNVLSNSNKPTKLNDDNSTISQYSLVQNNYQLDIYKINNNKLGYIEANQVAGIVREYLKSFDCQDYLKALDIEILPCYSNITFLTEFNEQKHLVNRAYFEFSLIYEEVLSQSVYKIDKIQTNNTILGG